MKFSLAVAMGEMTGSLAAYRAPKGTVNGALSSDGRTLTIAITGRLDFSLHESFGNLYLQQPATCVHFVVDFQDATSLDSSALGMLLLMRERLGGERSSIAFTGVNLPAGKTLQIANFNKLFVIN